MRMFRVLLVAIISVSAYGEVVSSSANGFSVKQVRTMSTSPAKAFAAIVRVQSWWSSEHTYSGNASNLSIEPRAGGCFCEKLPDGGVQHMTVVYVQQNQRLVLSGGLGPLQTSGLAGAMTIEVKPAGDKTQFGLVYNAGGYFAGNMAELAAGVDQVLGAQVDRLTRLAETGSADPKK